MKSDDKDENNDHSFNLPPVELSKINRFLSRKIPKQEKESLIIERQKLVNKKYSDDGLTRGETNRFKLINWQLDRIEDAEIGEKLDSMEQLVIENEKFSCELNNFIMALHNQK